MKTKIKYAVIIFVALIAQSCSNEKIENGWKRDNLQGKVLSYSEFSYETKNRFGKIEKGKRKRDFFWKKDIQTKYNEKGNQIETNWYNSDGSLNSKIIYKYDEKGNQIEQNEYNSDGSLNSKIIYKYDEKGNQIEQNGYNSDGSLYSKIIYKYDEKRNKIEENLYNSDGSLDRKLTSNYEYDKQGNWIKRIDYTDEIPKFILEREYEYYD